MDRATRMRRTPRRRISILSMFGLVAALALVTSATVAYAATPEVVLDDPAVRENTPSASDGYLVWSADSEAKPGRFHSYVLADGGSPVRIDPAGGQSRGAAIDGTTIVYEEDFQDLGFFDAVTEARSDPPAGVNTPNSEYRPTLSGDWLLFTRDNVNRVATEQRLAKGRAVQHLHLCEHRAPEAVIPLELPRERSGERRLGHVRDLRLPVQEG